MNKIKSKNWSLEKRKRGSVKEKKVPTSLSQRVTHRIHRSIFLFQIITSKKGRQELWVLTASFQKYMTGTLRSNETNFRIQAGFVDELIRGTKCDVSSLETYLHSKWWSWHREQFSDYHHQNFSPKLWPFFMNDRPFGSRYFRRQFEDYYHSRYVRRNFGIRSASTYSSWTRNKRFAFKSS